jgi:hypothetical protein
MSPDGFRSINNGGLREFPIVAYPEHGTNEVMPATDASIRRKQILAAV